jgi:hypothetical protein
VSVDVVSIGGVAKRLPHRPIAPMSLAPEDSGSENTQMRNFQPCFRQPLSGRPWCRLPQHRTVFVAGTAKKMRRSVLGWDPDQLRSVVIESRDYFVANANTVHIASGRASSYTQGGWAISTALPCHGESSLCRWIGRTSRPVSA